tara:strand:- start:127 stop:786 length:660 start_codon:yes stop_codon:yes gene_type:complete
MEILPEFNLNKSSIGKNIKYEITLKDSNEDIGYFEISGEGFNTGKTMSMGIEVDENYQGKGYSKLMTKKLCEFIRMEFPRIRDDQYLYIDTDASEGFWNRIGMEPNPTYDMENPDNIDKEGSGYESRITFKNLELFGNKYIGGFKYYSQSNLNKSKRNKYNQNKSNREISKRNMSKRKISKRNKSKLKKNKRNKSKLKKTKRNKSKQKKKLSFRRKKYF